MISSMVDFIIQELFLTGPYHAYFHVYIHILGLYLHDFTFTVQKDLYLFNTGPLRQL